jgi:hypothetical protein
MDSVTFHGRPSGLGSSKNTIAAPLSPELHRASNSTLREFQHVRSHCRKPEEDPFQSGHDYRQPEADQGESGDDQKESGSNFEKPGDAQYHCREPENDSLETEVKRERRVLHFPYLVHFGWRVGVIRRAIVF